MDSDRHLTPVTWSAGLYVFVFYVAPMTFDFVVYTGDLLTDIRVAQLHYHAGSPTWGFWTVFFVFFPAILCLALSLYRLFSRHSDDIPYVVKWTLLYVLAAVLFPLYPILR